MRDPLGRRKLTLSTLQKKPQAEPAAAEGAKPATLLVI